MVGGRLGVMQMGLLGTITESAVRVHLVLEPALRERAGMAPMESSLLPNITKMPKLLQLALSLFSGALQLLDNDDKDAIIDAIELKLIHRQAEFPDRARRYRAAMVALRALRGISGIPDDDLDQSHPV